MIRVKLINPAPFNPHAGMSWPAPSPPQTTYTDRDIDADECHAQDGFLIFQRNILNNGRWTDSEFVEAIPSHKIESCVKLP